MAYSALFFQFVQLKGLRHTRFRFQFFVFLLFSVANCLRASSRLVFNGESRNLASEKMAVIPWATLPFVDRNGGIGENPRQQSRRSVCHINEEDSTDTHIETYRHRELPLVSANGR